MIVFRASHGAVGQIAELGAHLRASHGAVGRLGALGERLGTPDA